MSYQRNLHQTPSEMGFLMSPLLFGTQNPICFFHSALKIAFMYVFAEFFIICTPPCHYSISTKRTGTLSCSPLYHHYLTEGLTYSRFLICIDWMGEEAKGDLETPRWVGDLPRQKTFALLPAERLECNHLISSPYHPPESQTPESKSGGEHGLGGMI